MYNYWLRGGYNCILIENILNIIISFSVLFIIIFTIFCLNWYEITKCMSEETCKDLLQYVVNPLVYHNKSINIFMLINISIFGIYWLWLNIVLINEIIEYIKYKKVYTDLGFENNNLYNKSWISVIKRLENIDSNITKEIIVGSIMKNDNYLISIIGTNVLNINKIYYTKTFLWFLNNIVINQINYDNLNTKHFIVNTNKIKNILKIFSIGQLLVLPFIIILYIIRFIINIITDIYSKSINTTSKDWTIYSKYLFREYNELPHIINDRIEKSYMYVNMYQQKFQSRINDIILEKIIFILGTYLSILVLLMIYDDRLVMFIKLFDRNLLWYLAIITSIITIIRLSLNKEKIKGSYNDILLNLYNNIHYYPDNWNIQNNNDLILNELNKMYKYKIINIVYELFSLIIIPIYILFFMTNELDIIIHIITNNTIYINNVGFIYKINTEDNTYDEFESLITNNKISRSINNFNEYYSNLY